MRRLDAGGTAADHDRIGLCRVPGKAVCRSKAGDILQIRGVRHHHKARTIPRDVEIAQKSGAVSRLKADALREPQAFRPTFLLHAIRIEFLAKRDGLAEVRRSGVVVDPDLIPYRDRTWCPGAIPVAAFVLGNQDAAVPPRAPAIAA